ncbi:MAG: DegV family protein [Dictyoglomaceae bacterium]|nr:DegV family protein [Dictyoglomaceae bacterium]
MIRIVTDSTAALPDDFVRKYNVLVVPLKVAFGDEIYNDGVDITPIQFFDKIKKTNIFPKTSQPSVEDFYNTYKSLENADAIISIHISSKLSGTIGSANTARAMLPFADKIYVIDSLVTEFALGYMVIEIGRAIEEGKNLNEIFAIIDKMKKDNETLFTVDTLEYLYRGGRIGAAQAWMGSILQIKPILELRNGAIEPVERVRTKQKVKDRILDIMKERIRDIPVKVAVAYSDNADELKNIEKEIYEKFNVKEYHFVSFSCTILSHIGPGSWGIICYKM